VTRSPLYSIYGETIAGVAILRAFGASSKFLRDMIRCVDTVSACRQLYSMPTYVYSTLRTQTLITGRGEVGTDELGK